MWQPVAAAVGLATLERKFTTELVDGQRHRRQTSRYEGPGLYQLSSRKAKTVVYVANQAGQTPETCLRHYAPLFPRRAHGAGARGGRDSPSARGGGS